MEKFAASNWGLIFIPAQQWLDSGIENSHLIEVIQQVQQQCGNCGCELDQLYPKALKLLVLTD